MQKRSIKNKAKTESTTSGLPKQEALSSERDLLKELNVAKKEIAQQVVELKEREDEFEVAEKELAIQTKEKEEMADELSTANKELKHQEDEKQNRIDELSSTQTELDGYKKDKKIRIKELGVAKKELAFQNSEKADRASELVVANKELIHQEIEKHKKEAEFIVIKKAIISKSVEIENLTFQTQMSGLNNRKYFLDALKSYDFLGNLPISIIMGDINGLAIIKDSLGSTMVDVILTSVVKILSRVVRKSDISICFSNGEFALILPKTSSEKSKEIIRKLKAFATKEKAGNFDVSISCGTHTKTKMEMNLEETVTEALAELNDDKKTEGTIVENDTIGLIMEMLFEKNSREMYHSSRVGEICESLAKKLNFDHGVVDRIRTTGMFHDIGKIGIDEKILNKPGKLDEHEWNEIKKHPEIGYRILSASNEFIMHANDVLQHHERIDGKGYPKGIKGDEISLVAKIIAIADTYDALTSERTYRETLSEDDAIEEIKRCSGTQFDSEVVKVFESMMREKRNLSIG